VEEDNIKITEIGWGKMDWIRLPDDREKWWAVVNTVMDIRVT
jgi:hypothetical protein